MRHLLKLVAKRQNNDEEQVVKAVKSVVAVDCIFCSKEFPSQRMLACHTKVEQVERGD